MAADPDIQVPAPWVVDTQKHYTNSPSALSINSISSSASGSSVDAPSSQSSISSASTASSDDPWLVGLAELPCQHQDLQSWDKSKENAGPRSNTTIWDQLVKRSQAGLAAAENRQNPRRTQRLNRLGSRDGVVTSQCPLPPPSLVRQSERKSNFVDSLVDTTTQMIEAIWPLSTYASSCSAGANSRQPSRMPLKSFVQEVLRRSKTSYSTLQVALYYLILIRPCLPICDFTMEQAEDSESAYSLQCGRRMFISALITASKYLQDRNFSANAWSKISGLNTWDLNLNERAFLDAVRWKCHVPEELWHRWTDIVLTYSPAANPGSRWRHQISWKELVLRLTPELPDSDFGGAELSDDSGYNSPGSDMSPPSLLLKEEVLSDETTPTPSATIPQWSTRKPQDPARTVQQRPPLLPQQPHFAPLPTPDLTPQTGPLSTPAVSALGSFPRRPSMSHAMSHMKESSLARCSLDNTSEWKPRVPEFAMPTRRSSLTTSASSASPPESVSDTSTQYSDLSTRPSRSSSISSLASSTCAPVQPTKLAVQATRRCANMQLNESKGQARPSVGEIETAGPSWLEICGKTGANAPHLTMSKGMKADMHKLFAEREEYMPQPKAVKVKENEQSESLPIITSYPPRIPLPPQQISRSSTAPISPSTRDAEAAAALQELALNRRPNNRRRNIPHLMLQPTLSQNRKRARPNSLDLSVEGAVRKLIAPRCLGDITNANRRNEEDRTIIPDDCVADSFLLRKENKHALKEANKRPTKAVKTTGLKEVGLPPSKKKVGSAGSDRGGREEVRTLHCLR